MVVTSICCSQRSNANARKPRDCQNLYLNGDAGFFFFSFINIYMHIENGIFPLNWNLASLSQSTYLAISQRNKTKQKRRIPSKRRVN